MGVPPVPVTVVERVRLRPTNAVAGAVSETEAVPIEITTDCGEVVMAAKMLSPE